MSTNADDSPRNKRILILITVFALLAVAVVVVWRRAPAEPDLVAGRTAADEFLGLIRAGQASKAWDATTAEFKSFEGKESFVRNVKKHPELTKPATFVSVQSVAVQNLPRAEYIYRAADGKHTVRLLAGNERDHWRIDRMTID